METDYSITDYSPFDTVIDKSLITTLNRAFRPERVAPLNLLSQTGVPVSKVGCVCSGTIELMVETQTGKTVRRGSVGPGGVFNVEVLLGRGTAMFNALALEPVDCLVIDKAGFIDILSRDARLKSYFEDNLANRLRLAMINPVNAELQGEGVWNRQPAHSLKRAISYIDDHYTQNISLNDLARVNCLSRYYFSRKFKEETGHCFKDYLNLKRLSAAKKLLALPEVNISEACYSVGFNDVSYFSRVFKKYVGVSPSAYKKTPAKQRISV